MEGKRGILRDDGEINKHERENLVKGGGVS